MRRRVQTLIWWDGGDADGDEVNDLDDARDRIERTLNSEDQPYVEEHLLDGTSKSYKVKIRVELEEVQQVTS